ncbi:unnamed protein product [Dicrocoelium dendriticum]|nr:unnamed protein product [Dicrocoelium dendriticum]
MPRTYTQVRCKANHAPPPAAPSTTAPSTTSGPPTAITRAADQKNAPSIIVRTTCIPHPSTESKTKARNNRTTTAQYTTPFLSRSRIKTTPHPPGPRPTPIINSQTSLQTAPHLATPPSTIQPPRGHGTYFTLRDQAYLSTRPSHRTSAHQRPHNIAANAKAFSTTNISARPPKQNPPRTAMLSRHAAQCGTLPPQAATPFSANYKRTRHLNALQYSGRTAVHQHNFKHKNQAVGSHAPASAPTHNTPLNLMDTPSCRAPPSLPNQWKRWGAPASTRNREATGPSNGGPDLRHLTAARRISGENRLAQHHPHGHPSMLPPHHPTRHTLKRTRKQLRRHIELTHALRVIRTCSRHRTSGQERALFPLPPAIDLSPHSTASPCGAPALASDTHAMPHYIAHSPIHRTLLSFLYYQLTLTPQSSLARRTPRAEGP